MRFRPPLHMSFARREEKEQKLKGFLLRHVAAEQHAIGAGSGGQMLVIARSMESPVARAIFSAEQQIAGAGYSLRMIVALLNQEALLQSALPDLPVALDHEIRWAENPRLLEAHEQLVVGPRTCWIGDCMRREPSKCDAFESFIDNCQQTAASAVVSFERLWSVCRPMLLHSARLHGEAGSTTIVKAEAAAAPAPTRH